MCYPCQCPRRSVSCNGGGVCCPRPCCRERSRSTCSPRVIFPGEFQKFSDMIPPSFLLKQPQKSEKVKKKSNSASQAAKRKKRSDSRDKRNEDNLNDPEEQRIPGESMEMRQATHLNPGNPSQPTDTTRRGNNGPWENPMTIDMPPQPQWVCFECPATICVPRDPPGLPAAGLPTKRSPPFNPCTGQVYQCENRQLMVGNNETAQCPTYNQFCQGVNICLRPANPCYQFNPSNFGDGANSNEPNRNQPYYQSYQGVNMGYGKATETRKGINSNQRHQYNQHGYGEGTNPYEGNRDQPYSQFCQCINMCTGSANPYYPYDGGDKTCLPPPEDPRSLSTQGDNRSKSQRKGKETREGNVGKAAESRKDPIGGQNPSSGHVPQGNRSTSQGTRREQEQERREAPRSNRHNRSNSRNLREESIGRRKDPQLKQSRRVAQQNPAADKGVSQYGNRSRSQTRGNHSIEAPRLNNQNQYNSHNPRKEPIDPRISLRSNSSSNQVRRSTNRSMSLGWRNETRRDSSARVPHPSKSRATSPERALNGDGRSKSLGKRNDPRVVPLPESDLHVYQQNGGMSFGPSSQDYIADCPTPDLIYTTQLESTVGDSGSRRQRNESQRRTSTRKNGESRKESEYWESLPGNQPARGDPPHQTNQCYNLRFNPNNQYCQYYMPDECFCPPSPEDLRSPWEENHDLASNDRSQLFNRVHRSTNKSRSLDDRQMSTNPTKTSKKQPASGAKSTCKKSTQCKPGKQKPTIADILANEISSQPHVLVLKTQKDEKKKKNKKITETPDQCCCDAQDEVSSCESLEDSSIYSATVTDNGEDKPQEKAKKKTQEKAKKKVQEESQEEAQEAAPEEAQEFSNREDAETSGCPNSCWMRCPVPWSCCYAPCNSPYSGPWNGPCNGPSGRPCGSPCNGRFYYCGNCCNGCRQCCNYCCNPCGGYCCSQPPVSQVKASTKSKEKPAGEKVTQKRNQGGASESHCILANGFPVQSPSTTPGYYPTVPPQFFSPYSGHWQASEVVSNPMFSKQYP